MRKLVLSAISLLVALLLTASPASAFFFQEKAGPQSATNGIALGPDGNFWVAEEFSNSVVRLSPAGAVLNRYVVGNEPQSVANGPGGRVWVTVGASDKLVWFDATSATTPIIHTVTTPGDCGPVAIVAGGDGRMYFSLPSDDLGCNAGGPSRLGFVADDGTGAAQAVAASGEKAFDLEVAGGKLFVPDFDNDVINRRTLGTLALESSVSISAGGAPDGITADGAGNIWVTEYNSGKIARFPAAQTGGAAQEFTPTGGTLTNPFGIVAGSDGRMYIAGGGSANIVRMTPDGSSFAFYSLPDSEPFNIINGPDGDPWFTDRRKTRIVHLVNSAPRAATGAAGATAPTSASAQASVNPRGNDTQVVFDYGPTTAYGSASVPFTVLSGADPVEVTGVMSGLAPSTTYHVRVRASNGEGSVTGNDTTFTTPPAPIIDADRDGVSPPLDCRDDNAAIHPGAFDKPGDNIDQDCSGTDALFPELVATTNFTYRFAATTVITRIDITRLRGGETATLRCTGLRCPFKTKTYRNLKKGKRSFGRKLLRGRRLPARTKVQVRVTKAQTIGTYTVLEVRRNKRPKIRRACLKPGATKPSACP